MRVAAGVALVATFVRLTYMLHLPLVFLLLPVSLCALPWILKYIPGLQVCPNKRGSLYYLDTSVNSLNSIERKLYS